MSLIDITCGDCGARFRLDKALLKDSSAARIRCRKCGGRILVRLQEEPPIPPSPPAPDAPETPPEMTAPPLEEAAPSSQPDPALPAMLGVVYPRQEDMFAAPPPPEDYPVEETAEPEPGRKVPPRRASSRSTLLVISVLWVLLLAGGAFYFGTTKAGRDMVDKLFPGWGSTPPGGVTGNPYDIQDVKLSFEMETASGTLFVVTGKVANLGQGPSGGIGIRATLLGKDNQALVEKTAFAGNVLDEASMRRMDRPAIERAMSNRYGEGDVNRGIPAGKALPFMVLFFDPPSGFESVMVKAIDAR